MKNLLFIGMLLSSLIGFGQRAKVNKNLEANRNAKEKAKKEISELKDGVLLVRLHGRTKEINYYLKYNNAKAAEKVSKKANKRNQMIVNAFRQNFDFCPVYFFEDTFSMQLLNGQLDKIVFYSDSLTPDSSIKVNSSKYFIAELGMTENNAENFQSDTYITTDETGTHRSDRQYGDASLNISAIVIRDKKLNQLRKPFPYYMKVFSGFINKGRINHKVDLWNSDLHDFLESTTK